MAQGQTYWYGSEGRFGTGPYTNPQMRRQQYAGQQPVNAGQTGFWNQLLGQQFSQGPQQVQAMNIQSQNVQSPTMNQDWQKYLQRIMNQGPITTQNVQAQNINAPTMSQDWRQWAQQGTQGVADINAAGMQDTAALIKSYDPLLAQQQAEGFAGAALRAGKTGMWGSPYATALGSQVRQTEAQRANIANQALYQASEAAAGRQMQAAIANQQAALQQRANQLQAAGLSADQARVQAQMELQASISNQGAGLQAGMANQQANLQAQIQGRAQQLQAAGLSADQAYRQAQMELSAAQGNQQAALSAAQANQQAGLTAGQANQQAGLQYGNQILAGQQQQQQQMQTMFDRFLQQYGDIVAPDDLWNYLSQIYNTGGSFGQLPQTPSSAQPAYGQSQYNINPSLRMRG